MTKGYTTPSQVAAYLGVTFTTAQTTQATALEAAVEAFIDRVTNRGREANGSWSVPPIIGEQYWLTSSTLYLKSHPVSTVDLVQKRTTAVGDTLVTLTAGVDYELQDPLLGRVEFSPGYASSYADPIVALVNPEDMGSSMDQDQTGNPPGSAAFVVINYTPAATCPADISLAASALIAWWMTYQIDPTRYGLASQRMGQEQISLDAATAAGYIPPWIKEILEGYRMPVIA